ncbi:MAG: hypothetical protein ACFE9L_08975 [Candidatus Hodarchaeota archaeon]
MKDEFIVKKKENEIIAEMKEKKKARFFSVSDVPKLDLNELLSIYFHTIEILTRDFSRSLLNKLDIQYIEPSDHLDSIQEQLEYLKEEVDGIKKQIPSYDQKFLFLNFNIPFDLLQIYQNRFQELESIKLVLLKYTEEEFILRIICDKTHTNFISEEQQIYKVDYNARKKFSLAKKITLILDGILTSKETTKLMKESYVIVNKFHEL